MNDGALPLAGLRSEPCERKEVEEFEIPAEVDLILAVVVRGKSLDEQFGYAFPAKRCDDVGEGELIHQASQV
jgi:hypothetical protein